MVSEELEWINTWGWTNIKDERPPKDTEVVIFYIEQDEREGTCSFMAEVMHEGFIDVLHSPMVYWIRKPRE